MIIGVTDTIVSEGKYQFYVDWLQRTDVSVDCMRLSYKLDNLSSIEKCDALLLTGGNDVDPSLYSGIMHHRLIKDVDTNRDDFERKVLDKAIIKKMPILAICRGMQLVNVHFGGTLVPDIEEAGFKSHRSEINRNNHHGVSVVSDSNLHRLLGVTKGIVNSSHHQAVDRPGKRLKAVVHSDDGIIEAMELESDGNSTFFYLLQWHPERMVDATNPFTGNILKEFLQVSLNYSKSYNDN